MALSRRPPAAEPPPQETEAKDAPATGAGRAKRKRQKRDKADTVQMTINIPRALHFRLTGIAAAQKIPKDNGEGYLQMSKMALLEKMLDQGLSNFKIDKHLKEVWAETQRQDMNAA